MNNRQLTADWQDALNALEPNTNTEMKPKTRTNSDPVTGKHYDPFGVYTGVVVDRLADQPPSGSDYYVFVDADGAVHRVRTDSEYLQLEQ